MQNERSLSSVSRQLISKYHIGTEQAKLLLPKKLRLHLHKRWRGFWSSTEHILHEKWI